MQISIGISIDSNGVVTFNDNVSLPKTVSRNKGKSIIDFPHDYCVVDIETTGLSPEWDSIIEIAAVKYSDGKIVDTFQSLLQPVPYEEEVEDDNGELTGETRIVYVDEFITKLTGITNEMLAGAPKSEEVLPLFDTFLGNTVIVGYNVNFDVNFLYDAFEQYLHKTLNNDFIDVMRIARRLHPELAHHRLTDMVDFFGVTNENAHRALSDCYATETCYERLKFEAENKYGSLSDFCNAFLRSRVKYVKAENIVGDPSKIDPDNALYGKNIVFTGTLEKMTRAQAMQVVADLGGINQNNVTKKTNYLILGNNDYCTTIKDGKSNKQKKAEDYQLKGFDIKVLSENVFYEMIGEILNGE